MRISHSTYLEPVHNRSVWVAATGGMSVCLNVLLYRIGNLPRAREILYERESTLILN